MIYVKTVAEIGEVIRGRRNELGLDQADLAKRCGVSRQWLVAVERGKPRAQIELVLRVLRELDIDLALRRPSQALELGPIGVGSELTGELTSAPANKERDD